MLVDNRTALPATLARAQLDAEDALVAVVVEAHFAIGDGRVEPLPPGAVPSRLGVVGREAVWSGTSVTVEGAARGPARAPYVRVAAIHVGEAVRRVVVFGERVWQRGGEGVRASDPAPFDAIDVTWSRAFGGGYTIAPGLVDGLPHPGGRVEHPANPDGVGLYASASAAVGQRLPNVEDPAHLVRSPLDHPVPVGIAPCPERLGLRLMPRVRDLGASVDPSALDFVFEGDPPLALLAPHPAPGDLVFPDVMPGTVVRVEGVGPRPLAFALPRCPVSAGARRVAATTALTAGVRWVHVDAERAVATVVYDLSALYRPARAPTHVRLETAGGGA